MKLRTPFRIFIGYDSKEPTAYHVLAHSILRHATIPVSITPLVQTMLRTNGLYTRERGKLESTEFSMTRFLVPALCDYKGPAVFMDCDMLVQFDIAELLLHSVINSDASVVVCKHDYEAKEGTKFLNQPQTVYPRKNWSSLMVFNTENCERLTPNYVNEASGLDLHRFNWTTDDKVADLPLEWNWLVGEYHPNEQAKNFHWTLGGPWFPETANAPHADLWYAERARLLKE